MATEVINNNEKLNKLFADKEFMLGVLKKKSPEEVQKAFTDKGVKFEKNDVDVLGKALGDISAAIDKCSPEEVNRMANLFETVDPSKLDKVVGGTKEWKDILKGGAQAVVKLSPEDRLDLYIKLKDAGFIKEDGSITPAGEDYLKAIKSAESSLGDFKDAFLNLAKGSSGGQPTDSHPGRTVGGGGNNDKKSGGSNTGLYVAGGVGLAVAVLGVAYLCRDKISGWFGS